MLSLYCNLGLKNNTLLVKDKGFIPTACSELGWDYTT